MKLRKSFSAGWSRLVNAVIVGLVLCKQFTVWAVIVIRLVTSLKIVVYDIWWIYESVSIVRLLSRHSMCCGLKYFVLLNFRV